MKGKIVYKDIPLHSRAFKNVMKQVELAILEDRKVDLDMKKCTFQTSKGNPLGYYINVSIQR